MLITRCLSMGDIASFRVRESMGFLNSEIPMVLVMTLEEIIKNLDHIDRSLTIYAERSPEWSRSSRAELRPAKERPGESRYPYFLEIYVAKTVLQAWSFVRDGQEPNLGQKCEAIIYYAENDAYLIPPD